MSGLFTPRYTKTDPKNGEKVTHKTKKSYTKFRDANGIIQRHTLCTDKTAALT